VITEVWANEKLIKDGTRNTFQLPSDIKPGVYVLRTELLALHGNMWNKENDVEPFGGRGPQFYTHCFNIEILGDGNAEPQGVKFPSPQAMKQDDYGVSFNVYNQKKFPWPTYVSIIT
jgi:cellulase